MRSRTSVLPSALLLGTLTLSACGGRPPQTPIPPAPNPTLAIVRANLWDGTGRAVVPNAVTLIRAGRIACAGGAGECPIPHGARMLDAYGRWLIPGLIHSHVHLLFLKPGSAGGDLSPPLPQPGRRRGGPLRGSAQSAGTGDHDRAGHGDQPRRAVGAGQRPQHDPPGLRHAAGGRTTVLLQRIPGYPHHPGHGVPPASAHAPAAAR